MKILILNGSPLQDDLTQDLINSFTKGAGGAGHEVKECAVGRMNIRGCIGCQSCQMKDKGKCSQKDDMEQVYPELASADMIVFASPVHFSFISAQLVSAISRFWAQVKPAAEKYALIYLAVENDAYVGIEGYYKKLVATFEAEDMGIKKVVSDFTAGDGIPEEVFADLEAFGASI